MCDYLNITTLVLLTPFLAFLCPLSLLVGKTARLTNIESLPLILYFSNHFTVFLNRELGQLIVEKSK